MRIEYTGGFQIDLQGMKGYYKLRKKTLGILETKLPKELYYHSLGHTLYVLKACNDYIRRERINTREGKLLRIGALMHDIGFTESTVDHEEVGKNIAGQLMTEHGFPKEDITVVEGLILATRIPQSPKTRLERIICDCDLDYLGTARFYVVSDKLFRELIFRGEVREKMEWNRIQIEFMKKHTYHTKFAMENRKPFKDKRLSEIMEFVRRRET